MPTRPRDLWDVLANLQVLATPTIDDTNTVNTDLQAPPADTLYVRDTWARFQFGQGTAWDYDSAGPVPAYYGLSQWS